MTSRTTNITIVNNTECDLVLIHERLHKGKWSIKSTAPSQINAGSIGIWQSENDTALSGTKGTIQYLMKGKKNKLTLEWSNPLLGRNQYKISIPENTQIKRIGGIGNDTMVAFSISEKL